MGLSMGGSRSYVPAGIDFFLPEADIFVCVGQTFLSVSNR
jgi:hypothetical protein